MWLTKLDISDYPASITCMGDSWNTRTLSFADMNPTRRFKDFKDNNTSCIGMVNPSMNIAEKAMKGVTLEELYQTAYGKQPHFIKLPDFSETERASGIKFYFQECLLKLPKNNYSSCQNKNNK